MGKFKEIFEAEKYQIYCDMDGVLTDFESQFIKYVGITPAQFDQQHNNDQKEFWSAVEKGGLKYWTDMPWMKGGQLIWNFIKNKNPIILSAPARTIPDSNKGKNIWVKKELKPSPKVILIRSNEKKKYATPTSILIDDLPKNIADWTQAGGIGILHKWPMDTINTIKTLFDGV